jgi:hypothetical protein
MPNQSKPKTDAKSSQPKTIEEALARFQMEHHAAGKDGKAQYGCYTTLAGGLNAVQPATHLGLSHTQTFEHIVVGEKVVTVLKTRLLFTGEDDTYNTVIESNLPFPDLVPNRGNIMQALGSAITYARRYSLLAIYGLAGDDDDAEGSAPVAVKKEIARSPQRGAYAKKIANEMITGKAPTSTPPEQYLPLLNLEQELRDLAPNLRSEALTQFKALRFPKSNIVGNKGLFELIKTEQHINDVKAIIEDIKSDSP